MERVKHIILEILSFIFLILLVIVMVFAIIYEFYPMIFQDMGVPWLETGLQWISLIITILFVGFAIYSFIKKRRNKKWVLN